MPNEPCPDCDGKGTVYDPEQGKRVRCSRCGGDRTINTDFPGCLVFLVWLGGAISTVTTIFVIS